MTTAATTTEPTRPRDFYLVLLGQVISLLGTELTNFGLGVWVYQRTGSVTDLTLIFVCAALPGLLLAPFAGVYIDRWERRKVLILTDVGAAVGTLSLLALLLADRLELWCIYLVVGFSAAFLSFQIPAFAATVTLMVPKGDLGRANGLLQLGGSAAQIAGPLLAGALVPAIGLPGLITCDLVTFVIGVGTLLLARVPSPERSGVEPAAAGSLLEEAAFSFRYLRLRPGLLGLLAFFALLNLLLAMSQVLATPLVLARGTATQLGMVLAAGSTGMLFGALVMSVWGGPARRMNGVLGLSPVLGVACILIGASESLLLITAGIFLMFFVLPIINSCDQAIWQTKVEPELQGRVFGTRQLLEQFTAPLSYLAAGPLADRVFEPLLASGGRFAGSVGRLLGVGPGRGIGFQFVIMGCLVIAATLCSLAWPRLRSLEEEMADTLPDGPNALGIEG
jgi:DHA3 family macrolide efflux protein-like MFS transporter